MGRDRKVLSIEVDYGDEFDVKICSIFNEGDLKKLERSVKKKGVDVDEEHEIYFGSNEYLNFSVGEILKLLKEESSDITPEEEETFSKFGIDGLDVFEWLEEYVATYAPPKVEPPKPLDDIKTYYKYGRIDMRRLVETAPKELLPTLLTEENCSEAIKDDISNLYSIPKEFLTAEMLSKLIAANPKEAFSIVSHADLKYTGCEVDDARTDELFMLAVRTDGQCLRLVPKEKVTLEMCLEYLETLHHSWHRDFHYIPENLIALIPESSYLKVVERDGLYGLPKIPKDKRTADVCAAAIRSYCRDRRVRKMLGGEDLSPDTDKEALAKMVFNSGAPGCTLITELLCNIPMSTRAEVLEKNPDLLWVLTSEVEREFVEKYSKDTVAEIGDQYYLRKLSTTDTELFGALASHDKRVSDLTCVPVQALLW